MRRLAVLKTPRDNISQIMLHELPDETFLYLYERQGGGPSNWCNWFETTREAETFAEERYGITSEQWTAIPESVPGQPDDSLGFAK